MEVSTAAVWINTVFANFDLTVTQAIHDIFYPIKAFSGPFFDFVSLLGKGGIFLIILSLVLIWFQRSRRMGTAMLLGVSIGFIITNCIVKVLIARPRPYIDQSSIYYQLWLLVGQRMESDKSFPSGHTTAAFDTMTALFLTSRNKKISWTAFIFGIAMILARIYLIVHYPSDCIGGIAVGVAAGVIGAVIAIHLPRVWYELDFSELIRRNQYSGTHVKGDRK